MILALFHFPSVNKDDPNAGIRNSSVNSHLLLRKLVDHRKLHTAAVHNTRHLTSSAPHLFFDIEAIIEKSQSLSEAMIIEEVQKKLPSLPISYWNRHKNRPMLYTNKSCAKFTSAFDIEFRNIYW
jgi:hypothetical protein